MSAYICDFETTNKNDESYVWLWGSMNLNNENDWSYSTSIESFFDFLMRSRTKKVYFHNLKFDSQFIIYFLLTHGFKWFDDRKDLTDFSFTAVIDEMGAIFSLTIQFNSKKNKVNIYDSLKLINFSVEKIPKKFGLDELNKKEMSYEGHEVGEVITNEEITYLYHDLIIVQKVLKMLMEQNLNKITIASCALSSYKETIDFKFYFPVINEKDDMIMRKGYKGGYSFCAPEYQNKIINHRGVVLDVNSLYPSRMKKELLPYGEPVQFKGKYQNNSIYPLYMQVLSCEFELKKNRLPTLQIKGNIFYSEREYLTKSKGIETLCLTNIDLALFFDSYNVKNLTYNFGYMFKGKYGLFDKYIDYWTNVKITAKKNNQTGHYQIAKLMLNSLYGKFGTRLLRINKKPVLEDGIIKYKTSKEEMIKGIYLPMAAFITSYARNYTIRSIEKVNKYGRENYGYNLFLYADTDSMHLLLDYDIIDNKIVLKDKNIYKILDIDPVRLGAWDIETAFTKAKYIRSKCYIELQDNNKLNVHIAGMPQSMSKYVNFDNFKIGKNKLEFKKDSKAIKDKDKKLRYKRVKGGVSLVYTDFSLKSS